MYVIPLLDFVLSPDSYMVFAQQSDQDYSTSPTLSLYQNVYLRKRNTEQLAGPFNSTNEAYEAAKSGIFKDNLSNVIVLYEDPGNIVFMDFNKKRRYIIVKSSTLLIT